MFFTESREIFVRHYLERAVTLFISIVPGFIILMESQKPNFVLAYCFWHSFQFAAAMLPTCLVCYKLLPAFFPSRKLCASYAFWVVGCLLSIPCSFYHPVKPKIWATVLVAMSLMISQGILFTMMYSYLKQISRRAGHFRLNKKSAMEFLKRMEDDEFFGIMYLVFTEITIVFVPGIFAARCRFDWMNGKTEDICASIYMIPLFSILINSVPRRALLYTSKKQEVQLNTSHAIVRYISHEIRSPMNIVQNGAKVLLEELQNQDCSKRDIIEGLVDIHIASCAASSIVDSLLNFEKIDSGAFQLDKKTSSCIAVS